ncbi:MAG TPA: acetyl-CoA hydrolase/transferase C-terminal domain-containing protein, partial [Microthrixaceae bacterium]|nr:acetyl-CoA hydrolase/transferase C-terminal domain-containing protein [Microthrixaceae bacterium]
MTPTLGSDAGSPDSVLDLISNGTDLIVPLAVGEPVATLDAVEQAAAAALIEGVSVHQMHALVDRGYLDGRYGDRLHHISYFLSGVTRPHFHSGGIDLVPAHFSEVPHLLRHTVRRPLIIAAASLPDRHGYFSLGTNADYVGRFLGTWPVFLEANEHMPRTFGHNTVHISQVAGWCRVDRPLMQTEPAEPDETDTAIAALIAERVPDRATIQAGIGSIPNAVLAALGDHKDLGVHTELFSDGFVDLVEAGVVNGVYKGRHSNRSVTTFALGTKRLYDFLNGNPAVELLAVDFVNDPRVIAQEPRMVSINATTEVDILGQAASETIAGRYYSGSGGQADFAKGAMFSDEGSAFLVTRSTTRDGRSRIVTCLTPGSVVTTLKNTVDKIVTEWGAAELRGASLAQRADRLIAIAHPDHRDRLTFEARELG